MEIFVCDYRPLKDEKWKFRLVVGGDKLPYELDAGSPAASIPETKMLAYSVISDAGKGARFLSYDLKYSYSCHADGTSRIHEGSMEILSSKYYNKVQTTINPEFRWIHILQDIKRYVRPKVGSSISV